MPKIKSQFAIVLVGEHLLSQTSQKFKAWLDFSISFLSGTFSILIQELILTRSLSTSCTAVYLCLLGCAQRNMARGSFLRLKNGPYYFRVQLVATGTDTVLRYALLISLTVLDSVEQGGYIGGLFPGASNTLFLDLGGNYQGV